MPAESRLSRQAFNLKAHFPPQADDAWMIACRLTISPARDKEQPGAIFHSTHRIAGRRTLRTETAVGIPGCKPSILSRNPHKIYLNINGKYTT